MNTLLIIWITAIILSSIIAIVLDAIDIVDVEISGFVVLCIMMPPVILIFILYYSVIWFHDLCVDHKDAIRKFLRIK